MKDFNVCACSLHQHPYLRALEKHIVILGEVRLSCSAEVGIIGNMISAVIFIKVEKGKRLSADAQPASAGG